MILFIMVIVRVRQRVVIWQLFCFIVDFFMIFVMLVVMVFVVMVVFIIVGFIVVKMEYKL